MERRFITQLCDQEKVDEVFLVSEKQLRSNRNGNLYLQMRLADRTGSVTGMLWNANDHLYGLFNNGDFLRVQGTAQVYNGALQMIVNRIEPVPVETVEQGDFVTLAEREIAAMTDRLAGHLRGVRNYHLRNLAECFLADDAFMSRFTAAPAGVKNHHAYKGGLLQHVVGLIELCASVAPHYPEIDPDLLTLGAFLHDAGKIEELTYQRELGYSDYGQLVGHVVIGVVILEEKIREAAKLAQEEFPQELALRLKHMIVSHHGQYDFGSPKLPMTLEAIALSYLDDLDAKIHSIGQLIRDDANTDSPWTPYVANLQRKFFKGGKQMTNGNDQ
jgi:3'-5' exoribonuclease